MILKMPPKMVMVSNKVDVLPTPPADERPPMLPRRPTPRVTVTRASQSPADTLEVPTMARSEWSSTTGESPAPAKRKGFVEWVRTKILRKPPRAAK